MMKFRKKGVYTYWTLLYLIMYMCLSSILINIHMANEVYRRVVMATDEVARERARAIDTILKEQEGVVEVFHSEAGYDANTEDYAVSGTELYEKTIPGHNPPKRPSSIAYLQSLNKADEVVKSGAVDYLNHVLRINLNGKKIIKNFTKGNVCSLVEPLPKETDRNKTRDFECETNLGSVRIENVTLSSVEDNTVVIHDPNKIPNDGDEQKMHVLNVVFVGVKYEYYYFLSKMMKNFGASETGTGSTYAIAYPQIDKCYSNAINCS